MQKGRNSQFSWNGLVLALLMLPAFFILLPQGPSHINVKKESEKPYYTVVPNRAVTLTPVKTYKDKELSEKASDLPPQTHLDIAGLIRSGGKSTFILSNKTYLAAKTKTVGSDIVLNSQKRKEVVFTLDSVNVLYSPFTTFDHQIYTQISDHTRLQTIKMAKTHWGTYYEVSFDGGRTGWVDANSLQTLTQKVSYLQKILTERYQQSTQSIYVKLLDNELTASVNPDQSMYSASLSKLPIFYWVQKRLNSGAATLGDQLKYTRAVNDFKGAFKAEGTGSLPEQSDDQLYSLGEVIKRTAKESDNIGSNLLAFYETDQFSGQYRQVIHELSGRDWDPVERNASSKMVARVMAGLYQEGGYTFNALFDTNFDDDRIMGGIPSGVKVAHKIGSADDFNHDAAFVFSADPYILVIETYGGSNSQLSDISKTVYEALT